MSDIRQTVGDLDTLLTSAFDGTEFVEVFPTSGGVSKKTAAGTAVSADVQTSPTDTTAGALMGVGAFGLGGTGRPVTGSLSGINQSGFYAVDAGTTDRPIGELGVVYHANYSTVNGASQTYVSIQSERMFFRKEISSTWSTWVELYHSGNYPSDTGWTTVPVDGTATYNGWNATAGNVRYIKRAGMVTVVGRLDGTSATADTAFTLPAGYRPSILLWMATGAASGSTVALVNVSGAVELANRTADVRFSATYPVIT